MGLRRASLCLLLLSSCLASAAPAPEVQGLLGRMAEASKQLNYQGSLVYLHEGQLSTLKLTHVRDDDQEWEHLIKVDGKSTEVLRGGGDVIYRSPKGAATRLSSLPALARPQSLVNHLTNLDQYYDSTVSEGTRIAGREAVHLQLKPRDQDRYGYEFYLDKSTGLLLKSVMLNQTNEPLEIVSFSEIKIGPKVGLNEFKAARKPSTSTTATTAPGKTGGRGAATSRSTAPVTPPPVAPMVASKPPEPLDWQLWMPSGFTAAGPVRHKRINGAPVEVATFSDGLSSFSFFSESVKVDKVPAESQRQRGSTAYVSRQRLVGNQAFLITVVGELPLSVVQRIADSAARPAL